MKMKSQIKFRGWNTKNKKWLHGYYFVNRGQHFIVVDYGGKVLVVGDVQNNPEMMG